MTTAKQVGDFFEYHFQLWLQFHSEPLYYTKGPSMKISDKHLKAIARALHFVRSGITPSMQPKHVDQLENDCFLLDQIHTYLRQQINEPGLPLSAVPIEVGDVHKDIAEKTVQIGEQIGSAHKTTAD